MIQAKREELQGQWEKRVELRACIAEDLDQVMAIEQESFRTPWSRELFLKELSLQFAYHRVAELKQDQTIAGYLFCWLGGPEATILSLAIKPELRRQGLASYLLQRALDDFSREGIKEVWLEVRPSNFFARALYRKFDFQEVGIRPKYYYDSGEDAIVMKKNLDSDLDL